MLSSPPVIGLWLPSEPFITASILICCLLKIQRGILPSAQIASALLDCWHGSSTRVHYLTWPFQPLHICLLTQPTTLPNGEDIAGYIFS
jgi:hypothetical protein